MEKNWLDKNEYPFASRYHNINGHKLHYIDEGSGDTLLFVHGTPSWSFDFRHVIKELSASYRCIAVDHIGFGLSDKPQQYDYSTMNHSKTLEHFINHQGLKDITLIVHDFGGPIGLHYAIRHPKTIRNIVVMNSWLWSNESDPDYIRLRKLLKSPLLSFLYLYLNFSVKFLMPRSFGDKKLSKKALSHYVAPFRRRTERTGTLAFAQSLLHDQNWFESLWNARNRIADKEFLFVWGMKDPVIKPSMLEKFQSGFPRSHSLRLSGSGHFPQEEEPTEVTSAIRNFLSP